MPVALEDLRRARRGLEAEPLAGDPLHLGLGGGVGADGAGELPDAEALDRADEPLAITVERECPPRELEPERCRLGVDAVGPAHADRLAVLLGAGDDGPEGSVEALEHERTRVLHRKRERRVEHVRRREPVVEEAALLAEPLGDGVDEGRDVVVRLPLDLGDALGRRHDGTLANRRDRLARYCPDLGPPLEGGQLDVEPAAQLLAVRPDVAHGRAGVASDHAAILGPTPEAAAGAPVGWGCPTDRSSTDGPVGPQCLAGSCPRRDSRRGSPRARCPRGGARRST